MMQRECKNANREASETALLSYGSSLTRKQNHQTRQLDVKTQLATGKTSHLFTLQVTAVLEEINILLCAVLLTSTFHFQKNSQQTPQSVTFAWKCKLGKVVSFTN